MRIDREAQVPRVLALPDLRPKAPGPDVLACMHGDDLAAPSGAVLGRDDELLNGRDASATCSRVR